MGFHAKHSLPEILNCFGFLFKICTFTFIGVPLRHRRQLSNENKDGVANPSPTIETPVAPRQRQPFNIIGYSEDFKTGFVNPGAGIPRGQPRGVSFDAESPEALVEKPWIHVIPYVKPEREQKALQINTMRPSTSGSEPEDLPITETLASDIAESPTDIPSNLQDATSPEPSENDLSDAP